MNLMLSDKKILVKIHRNSPADFLKKLDILIKKQTHHKGKLPNDVSNFFYDFGQNDFYKAIMKPCESQKALRRKNYLLASSITTATDHLNQISVALEFYARSILVNE